MGEAIPLHLPAFAPECVVVGGGVAGAGEVRFDAVRAELARRLQVLVQPGAS